VCVGNYSFSTANGNVEGVDRLAGAGILHFPNIYVLQTSVNAHHSLDNSWFWCQVSSVLHKRFLSKPSICRPNLYWLMLLVSWSFASWKRPTSKLPWQCTCQINIQTKCVTSN